MARTVQMKIPKSSTKKKGKSTRKKTKSPGLLRKVKPIKMANIEEIAEAEILEIENGGDEEAQSPPKPFGPGLHPDTVEDNGNEDGEISEDDRMEEEAFENSNKEELDFKDPRLITSLC